LIQHTFYMKKHCISERWRVVASLVLITLTLASCELAQELTGAAATVAKIEGEWTCDEQSEIYKATAEIFTVAISADPDNPSGVIIDNFYGLSVPAKATVSGMGLIISNQTLEGGFSVSGSGTISSDYKEINLSYIVDDGSGTSDHCTAVLTKN
jgi:hypothetical protein